VCARYHAYCTLDVPSALRFIGGGGGGFLALDGGGGGGGFLPLETIVFRAVELPVREDKLPVDMAGEADLSL
jgi:hypothetical protein